MAQVIPAARLSVYGLDIPPEAHSFEGFRSWFHSLGENAPRASYIQGSLYIEVPQNYQTHGPLADAINVVLYRLAQDLGIGRYYLPPSWVTEEESQLSGEPDGFLVTWEALETRRVAVNPERPTELVGAPDMVLEVVSTSSARKDLVDLPVTYAAAGVREYWIVDGRGESPVLRVAVLGPDGSYADQVADRTGWVESPVWGRAFRLVRWPDRAGQPDYRLEVRASRGGKRHGRSPSRRRAP